MLTCKQASQLASKAMDGKLTWREWLGFRMHIALCSLCRRYVSDVNALRKVMRTAGKSGQTLLPESVKLSEQSRERIKQAFQKALPPSE